jgi:hypothetical protein
MKGKDMLNKFDFVMLALWLALAVYGYLSHDFWLSFLVIQMMLLVALMNLCAIRNRMK